MENLFNNLDWNHIIPALVLGGAALFSLKFILKKNSGQKIKSGDNSINIQTQGDTIISGTKNDKQ